MPRKGSAERAEELLAEVEGYAALLETKEGELTEAMRRRDEAIRAASREGGISLRDLGRAAGISHENVRLVLESDAQRRARLKRKRDRSRRAASAEA